MARILGEPLPNIPWEDRPAGETRPVWRCSKNPVIPRHALPTANSVFNSAAVPFGDGFAGVFRVDDRAREMRLHTGFSRDGVRWDLTPEPLAFAESPDGGGGSTYAYDPRVCRLDDEYVVTWCNGYHEWYPTIGIAKTDDFRTFRQLENAFLPYNRNGVLFPRRIGGRYAMLSRPSDRGHTPFGDIFVSFSPDLEYWGRHRVVMKNDRGWQSTKIGAGPVPIETDVGWLLIYHGVLSSCNGFVYSWGAALLDLEQPWRVIARTREYLMAPETLYECVGDTPNVTFPCAALADAATGRLAVYYGCADTCTGLAFGYLDDILDHVKNH